MTITCDTVTMNGDNRKTNVVVNDGANENIVKKVLKKKKLYVRASCGRCDEFITEWTVRTKDEKTTCPNRSGGEKLLSKYLDHYEHSELYPSHIKCTYLGPEHVLTFPDLKAAKFLLTRAEELDVDKLQFPTPVLKPISEESAEQKEMPPLDYSSPLGIGTSQWNKQGYGSSRSGHFSKHRGGSSKKSTSKNIRFNPIKITCGLVCPKCQFLLASSPTCHHLDLNGQVVVYKTSLKVDSSETPFEDNPPKDTLGENNKQDIFSAPHHNELPIIRSRVDFEEILLKSAVALNPDTSTKSQKQDETKSSEEQATPTSDSRNSTRAGNGKGGEPYEPADLVIVMGGQFWNPFCVSGVARLSDYKRRQDNLQAKNKHRRSKAKSNGDASSNKTKSRPNPTQPKTPSKEPTASSEPANDDQPRTPFPNISISSSSTTDSGILPNVNLSKKKHNRTLPMSIINVSEEASVVNMSSNTHVPCTFLLLDSLAGAGGVSPDKIIRKDIANTVDSLQKLPYFLVWYRGCLVHVEGTSQHIQSIQGAIVGLDIARYVDIVVPRIALGCQLAFAKAVLGLKVQDTETVETSMIAAELSKVWTTKESVPLFDDRPVLTVKL